MPAARAVVVPDEYNTPTDVTLYNDKKNTTSKNKMRRLGSVAGPLLLLLGLVDDVALTGNGMLLLLLLLLSSSSSSSSSRSFLLLT